MLLTINRKLIVAIPATMTAGFVFGAGSSAETVSHLKTLILPFTFLMVYPMMIGLNIRHLREGIKNVRLQVMTQVINFSVIPFIAYYLGLYFFPGRPFMALGLLLAALLPTSGMTISWTGFARGNIGAAINMTVIGLTLGSLATPFYVQAMMGQQVGVNFALIIRQIVVIIFLPMLFGMMTRQRLIKKHGQPFFKKHFAPKLPAISAIGVLGIVFVAIALKAGTILADPVILGSIFVPIFIIYLVNFFLSTLAGRIFFKRDDAIALVYGTVMRNLSIALAIAINTFGDAGADAALVIALSYIIQVQAAAWFVKFTDTVFGPVPHVLKNN